MKIDGSDLKRVSTGNGRTTCGYFDPGGKTVVDDVVMEPQWQLEAETVGFAATSLARRTAMKGERAIQNGRRLGNKATPVGDGAGALHAVPVAGVLRTGPSMLHHAINSVIMMA